MTCLEFAKVPTLMTCEQCKNSYPIVWGVPRLFLDQAS